MAARMGLQIAQLRERFLATRMSTPKKKTIIIIQLNRTINNKTLVEIDLSTSSESSTKLIVANYEEEEEKRSTLL